MKVLFFSSTIIISSSFTFESHMSYERKTNHLSCSSKHYTVNENRMSSNDNPYKAILFDIDGTLADSWKLGYDATAAILEKHDIPPITEEIYHECTKFCTPDRLARHAGLHPVKDEQKFQEVGNMLGKEFDDMYVNLVSTNTAGFYPGIPELIHSIPVHIKIGALTNACVAYAHAVLQVNSIHDRFVSIHGADSVPKPKPNPDGLLRCCMEMDVDPSQCVYIGDSPSDALAAHAAGMPSIGVAWGSHSVDSIKEAPFMQICANVDELVKLLPKKA